MSDYAYEGDRRITYGVEDEGATFIPRCETCGRYVTPDAEVFVSEGAGLAKRPNATCARCGRVEMVFEGFL